MHYINSCLHISTWDCTSLVYTHTHTRTYGTRLPLAVLNVNIVIIKRVVSKGERVGGTGCTRLGKARRANIISYLYTTCIRQLPHVECIVG